MSLHDEHLQTALRHAPDQELAPSQHVRENVLNYAANAVKPKPENWLKRILSLFAAWQVKRWQVAGMGALASMLLVIVMVREQMPEEPVWAKTESKSVAQAEVAQSHNQGKAQAPAANAPEAYQAAPQVAERAMPMREEAKAKRSLDKADLATQQAPAKELAEKMQISAAPESPKTAEMADAVEAVQAPEATVVVAAPKSSPSNEVEAKQGLAIARQATVGAKNEAPMTEAPNIEALLKQGGEVMAKQDIAVGNLRILKIETHNCDKTSKLEARDDETNYKVLVICDLGDKAQSERLQTEVGAYNQIMRNWQQTPQK